MGEVRYGTEVGCEGDGDRRRGLQGELGYVVAERATGSTHLWTNCTVCEA